MAADAPNAPRRRRGQPRLRVVADPADESPPKHHVTSYDVAKRAGVSQSAVSRCFKPGASVSKKMRQKVMKAAQELGYQPNAIARSLITRRSQLVAVIMSDFTNLHYPEVLYELNHSFARVGVHLLLFTLRRERDIEAVVAKVSQYQVDGVIVAASLTRAQIAVFEQRQTPVVLFNRTMTDWGVCSVCCDHAAGERLLVNALVNAGHHAFCIITGPEDSEVSVQRTNGVLSRLAELGIDDVPIARGDYGYDSGVTGIKSLAEQVGPGGMDVVMCANDVMAIGAIDAARGELGLAVPGDLSVVGFDGIAPGQWRSYDLTSIRQPVEQMSQAAVDMVMERVADPAKGPEMRLFSGALRDGSSARLR